MLNDDDDGRLVVTGSAVEPHEQPRSAVLRGLEPADPQAGQAPTIQARWNLHKLFGSALWQAMSFIECVLRLVGLDRTMPGFGTLNRRRTIFMEDMSKRPTNLLIDNEVLPAIGPKTMPNGFEAKSEGDCHAREHRGEKRHLWREASPRRRRADTGKLRHLAKMEWLPPPKPRRDEDALRGTGGAQPHGARLRSPSR